MLAYEPVLEGPIADGVQLLGIESTRSLGHWPTMRHVFDLEFDAGLYVEVDPIAQVQAYAVCYDGLGNENLTAL